MSLVYAILAAKFDFIGRTTDTGKCLLFFRLSIV